MDDRGAGLHDVRLQGERPLAGVRIADFSWHAMGPHCTLTLAMLGAETINIETRIRPNIWRRAHPVYGRMEPPPFDQLAVNKKSITLNLKDPRAVELAKQLITVSTLAVENFRPGVMDRLGLGYEALRAAKSDVILVSLSAAGQDGPESRHAGYAPMFSALGGLGHMTGYEDAPPSELRNAMDHVGGLMGALAAIAALYHWRRTGEGQHVDVSNRDVATCFIGETIVEYSMNRTVAHRSGNHDRIMSPHNCYPCHGNDKWISIAVATDAEWVALCGVMGDPGGLSSDPRFADAYARWCHREELDTIISVWTRGRTASDLTARLQSVGVAASPSFSFDELNSDPHLRARGALPLLARGDGSNPRPVVGPPWHFSRTPAAVDSWPPELGADNRYVFCELLGMEKSDLAQLEKDKVIY